MILDSEAAAMLDAMTGDCRTGAVNPYHERHENATSYRMERDKTFVKAADSGGASRFFFRADYDESETP